MSPSVRAPPGLAPERSQRAHQSTASGSPARLGAHSSSIAGWPQSAAIRVTEPREHLGRDALGVVGAARQAREGPVEDHRADALRVGGGEHRRGRAALRDAEDDRALDAHGVQHGQRVVDDVLERVGAGVRSERPIPRLSKAMIRANDPSRSKKRCASASSTPISRWLTKPLMNSRSTGPAPRTR